jgi:hypothetical protein
MICFNMKTRMANMNWRLVSHQFKEYEQDGLRIDRVCGTLGGANDEYALEPHAGFEKAVRAMLH